MPAVDVVSKRKNIMDIRTSVNTNAFLNDTGAVRNGMRNAEVTAKSTSQTETAPQVTSIQEETSSIKNTNDLFGYLKKSEKALTQISQALESGEESGSIKVAVEAVLETTTYKEQSIFENFRQPNGGSVDLKSVIEAALDVGDPERLAEIVSEQKEITGALLSDVKKELLGSSQSLDRRISTDIDTIKKDIESMSPVADVNSPDQLKNKLKALLG
jgi:hypothetical protein